MKRARFLIASSATVVAVSTPRLRAAAAERVRIVRRYGRVPIPGGCATHFKRARWASFNASHFRPLDTS
jgi:hypothetical protein